MNKEFIIILGVQSSGKSTQGKLLAEYLGYNYISTDALLRSLKEESNPVGEKLSEYWVKGDLVPDELMEEVLYPVLEKDSYPGVVLDGFPRTTEQFESFLAFLDMNDWHLRHVFYLDVGEEEAMKRMQLRAVIEKRLDETKDAIKKRVALYHKATEPLLVQYERIGKLKRIDGEREVEEIQEDIRSHCK
jgi:adenylate kinase